MLRKTSLLMMFLASLLIASSVASACDSVVSGTVYNKDKIVPGADVTVVCNNIVKHTVSYSDGSYSAFYTNDECVRDDKVKITARKGKLHGTASATMTDYHLEVDIAIADVFVKKIVERAKLQMTGFVDDYSKEVFVRLDNYGKRSDVTLTATLLNTGEQQIESLNMGKGAKKLRVFGFVTIDMVPGENVIELFARAGNERLTKYISYYNQ
jgi:hypothetical protein